MKDQFISYKTAKELSLLGFEEPCLGAYDSKGKFNRCTSDNWDNLSLQIISEATTCKLKVLAPLLQQAIQFFEDKYGILIHPVWFKEEGWHYISTDLLGQYNSCYVGEQVFETECFDTKQKALESAILMMIEIAKNKKTTIN